MVMKKLYLQRLDSAVNELTIANAATGSNPNITASGSDANIGINLTPKGVGEITFNGTGKVQQVLEKITVTSTVTTGTSYLRSFRSSSVISYRKCFRAIYT
jgi:hypothetical protein